MIMLDTHIWLWWAHDNQALPASYREVLQSRQGEGLAVSAISCWEIAKLVEKGRLVLPYDTSHWFDLALGQPNIHLLPLTPLVAVESTRLPPPFHADPADQLIVATARVHNFPLMTVDEKIRAYPFVGLLP